MSDRGMEMAGGTGETSRRIVESAQDVATRASSYVEQGIGRATERAADLADDANRRLERLTGRPLESWMEDGRRYVQRYPVQALAITVAVGYLLGKIVSRD
jgi:ElaB/YqjD/DUF883 family membrane-anchored ribosome-binding protein